MGFRSYDPATGQFVSNDPAGLAGGDINLRTYVGNQPTDFIDPTGLTGQKKPHAPKGSGKKKPPPPPAKGPVCHKRKPTPSEDAQAERDREAANQLHSLLNNPGAALNNALNGIGNWAQQLGNALTNGLHGIGLGDTPGSSGTGGPGQECQGVPQDPSTPTQPVGGGKTKVVVSADPNNITGPSGIGTAGFISSDATLPYTIDFENLPTATAPAQTVTVTQQLSPNLDWSTFQLGAIDFGSTVVIIPAGQTSYTTTIDATATLGLLVDVTAGINLSTGKVTWTFTAIDPTTLDLTSNPLAGFLPPDVTAPEGEGSVSYTIKPKANLTSGTVLSAQATVVFDTNAGINTPTLVNTIDSTPPTSSVNPLPQTTTSTSFTVSWSGSDPGGPGIAAFNVFVSDDGGPFQPLLSGTLETSTTFTGQIGHTYGFKSIATDTLGLTQTTPSAAQASISLVLPPPVVIAQIQLVENRKHLVTQIVITWSGALNAAEAATTARFHLATPGRRGSFTAKNAGTIKLKSAAYKPATEKVTLTPKKAFALSKPVQLRVYAELPFGLEDSLGRFINGGTDALSILTKREVIKSPAVAR